METLIPQELALRFYCYAITHKKANVSILDKCQIYDLKELKYEIRAEELIVLQTCNRIEIYLIGNEDSLRLLEDFLSKKSGLNVKSYAELMTGFDAIKHLCKVACGLESMFIGEEEILGQVKRAFLEAEELGIIGSKLRLIFQGAILAGKRARRETAISRGSVSVPSVAVKKAEKLCGGLRDKTVLVVGAGKVGELVVKELVKRKPNVILIANRTFDRAVKLAEKFYGQPVRLNEFELPRYLANADIVFVATKAPHLIIKAEHLEEALKINDHKIIIFDLAVPRNVDEVIKSKFNAEVYTIDELKVEAEENLKMRIKEIPKVEKIIEEELLKLQVRISRLNDVQKVKGVINSLEEIRKKELARALRKLKAGGDAEKIINLLSKSLITKISGELIKAISSEQNRAQKDLKIIVGGSGDIMSFMEKSKKLFEEALTIFPGGVHSPVRGKVKPHPFYVERAEGAKLYTADGFELLDYCMAYGALILGHRNPRVYELIREQLEKGWIYGTPTKLEVELARHIMKYFKSIEKICFVNSGCEATMLAIRVARAYTKRDIIVKFDGCYHGANDVLLASKQLKPQGVLDCILDKTLIARYNDYGDVEHLFRKFGDRIACVIIEPIAANMGLVISSKDFIKGLRELCNNYNSLLIFDEVVTGFRVSFSGAQSLYDVKPDITILGKIIGGGFPIGAVGGQRDVISLISPEGPVPNAGTFNANPISMAAGFATLSVLEEGKHYDTANKAAKVIVDEIGSYVQQLNMNIQITRIASMFHFFFTEKPVRNYEEALKSKTMLYEKLHEELLKAGVFIPPSQFEVCFTSSSHNDEIITLSISRIKEALRLLK